MSNRQNRAGFILPVVILTTLVVAILAASLQTVVWRATRDARTGLAGERTLHAADAAIVAQLSAWDARTFASTPIGARMASAPALGAGMTASVTLVRTSFDAALIEAVATSHENGLPRSTSRRVTRALTVRNAPLALVSPLTILGAVTGLQPGTATHADELPTGWDADCAGRDSVDAPPTSPVDTAATRAQFDTHWSRWLTTASRVEHMPTVTSLVPVVTGSQCAPGSGDPARGATAMSACTNEWGARAATGGITFTVRSPSRFQGVLMIDGNLNVEADLDIGGLLMVRGALRDTLGHLRVTGAALIRDEMGLGNHLGIATRVRYSRCALRRALSATGAPAAITTGGWLERF
ncbi:MAG: hypothetical protein ACO1Q7_08230 [Gemmatimonas sp.]